MTEQPQKRIVVFFDLDGVLADFDKHAHDQGKFDAAGTLNWNALDYAWWSSMPPCDGARAAYDSVTALVGNGNVKFMTAPVLSEECFAGKAHWVEQFLPEKGKWALMDLWVVPSKDKYMAARSGYILIDDREENVKAWNAAGGIGIHHNGDFTVTMKKLNEAVAVLQLCQASSASPGNTPKPPL